MRRAAAACALVACAGSAWAQAAPEAAGPHQKANESFFGAWMFVLLVLPIALTAFLARRRAKSQPSKLPVWDDATFQAEVVEARTPVLVHFALDWNVANRAALAQTEILAYLNRGNVRVGLVKVDAAPQTLERFPGLEVPAYVLFHQGRKLFHRTGLWQADDLQQLIDAALAREGF